MRYTDNQKEVFDIVDEHDNVIGKATRGQAHADKNLIHRSIGVVVFNKKGKVFLQQRSATKDTEPLKWTISASGHVTSSGFTRRQNFLARKISRLYSTLLYRGDPILTKLLGRLYSWFKRSVCDLRKFYHASRNLVVYEKAAHRELVEELGVDLDIEPIGKYICRAPFETEMQMLYRAQSEGPFRFHPQEIKEGTFFTQEEIERLYKEGKLDLSFSAKVSLEKVGFSLAQ